MVENKHYASGDIQKKLDDLEQQLLELKELAFERKHKLHDSLKAQQVFKALEHIKNDAVIYEELLECPADCWLAKS